MKEAFTLFDTDDDDDGKIAPSKLGILMRSLGSNSTQAQLKSIIAEEKLTAPFDFNRFLDLMSKHLKPEPFDRQLHDAFKVLDKDGTGFDVVSDLKHILTSIGENLEPAEFDEWIREAKMGGKGKKRREKNYRATHGGTTRLPPPPTPSSLDALPSKLRQIMAFQVLGKLHPIMQIGRKEMKE